MSGPPLSDLRSGRRAPDRIAITYVGFLLGHGGDALQMLDVAAGAQAAGAKVKIIVPLVPNSLEFAKRCAERSVKCERTDLITSDMHASRQRFVPLLRLLWSNRFALLHFHTGDYCLPRLAVLAMTVLRIPRAIVTVHSPDSRFDPSPRRSEFWAKSVDRRFHTVICPSEHGRAFQIGLGVSPQRCRAIHNGVDLAHFETGSRSEAFQALGVSSETPIVLFTSRLDEQKRPVDGVRIFGPIAVEHPEALLVFVGSGELEDQIRREAARLAIGDRVRLLGYRTDVVNWLQAATVWIFPTARENFSVALLEALSAGCAILATDCPGNNEVLVNGQNAYTFEVGDVSGAVELLRRLLSDAALRARLGQGARETAQLFGLKSMVDKHLMLYERALLRPVSIGREVGATTVTSERRS